MKGIKRLFGWQLVLGIILIALSLLVYEVEYIMFRDAKHITLYFFQDLAFVFVEVLLVTLVLHRLLAIREKRALMKKMNMVIGAFFSEVGTQLIRIFRGFVSADGTPGPDMSVSSSWTARKYAEARKAAASCRYGVDLDRVDFSVLRDFLVSRRPFLLGLLENPNLLEHESFTNLLWAVFHLTEELSNREDFRALPKPDIEHLAVDIKRAYGLLVSEWLAYMSHLQGDYPYLFSLAVRTNPFDPRASAVVR